MCTKAGPSHLPKQPLDNRTVFKVFAKPHLCFRKLKVTKLDLYYAVLISVLTWFVFIDILIVFAALTREMLFLPLEHEIHIFSPPCNILRVCCNNHFMNINETIAIPQNHRVFVCYLYCRLEILLADIFFSVVPHFIS